MERRNRRSFYVVLDNYLRYDKYMNSSIVLQRVESAAIFIAATGVYFASDLSWIWYVILLFSFDIFMAGYVFNSKVGAVLYNIGHSYTMPSLIVIAYCLFQTDFLLGLACLWFAHIGFDRMLGYGLKFSSGFKHTHLGTIGK